MLTVAGMDGTLSHSTKVSVTVNADSTSISNVINQITTAGCINSARISNALTSQLVAAQTAINAGDIETAPHTLKALLGQISAESGKHIATSCAAGSSAWVSLQGSRTFNPVDVLTQDIEALLATLRTPSL